MEISDLIKKHSLSAIDSVKRINPSAYWDDVKLSELPKGLFSLPKLQHLDISDNPFTELPFVKNNALNTLKIARTPFGIFKSNILKTKQFYAACAIEDPVTYADDKTIYLSATKKYYSSIHPSGYHII